jgi:hypothetical protein
MFIWGSLGLLLPGGRSSVSRHAGPREDGLVASLFRDPRQARDAPRSVVDEYGPGVLADPRVLGSLLADLLPGEPQAARIIIAAAEADIAGGLLIVSCMARMSTRRSG